jgi:hypothetical protein
MMTSLRILCAMLVFLGATVCRLQAWSDPHVAITHAAIRVLPSEQRAFLGDEQKALGDRYCLIPDHVFSDPVNAKFAMMESRPGERYLTILHLPTTPPEYEDVLRYFVGKAVDAFGEGRVSDGARFSGTICHLIEDYCSPSHVMPGDNMLTLLRQFLPPAEHNKHRLMHGPVEGGTFALSIEGYAPRLLGVSVSEIAWRLVHRIHEGIVNARGTTVPILRALDSGDQQEVVRHQTRAAEMDARIVADALYSMLALASGQILDAQREKIEETALGRFFPLEAPALYYPQKQFFGSPHWGHPTHGYLLRDGEHEEPLRLKIREEAGKEQVRIFPQGISTGGRSSLTYTLPEGVFRQFQVFVGLQAALGDDGEAEFSVEGDGRALASVTVRGEQGGMRIRCDITGVRQLRLVTHGRSSNAKQNYTVWGDPVLSKLAH